MDPMADSKYIERQNNLQVPISKGKKTARSARLKLNADLNLVN